MNILCEYLFFRSFTLNKAIHPVRSNSEMSQFNGINFDNPRGANLCYCNSGRAGYMN